MGYLRQKKKYTNIRELLNVSLVVLFFICTLQLFFDSWQISTWLSHWLFQIYVFALIVFLYALFNRFFLYAFGLFICVFILFLNVGMGGNLFFDIKTAGTQKLNILYLSEAKNIRDISRQIKNNHVDIAGIVLASAMKLTDIPENLSLSSLTDSKNLILSPHKILRSGEILLSKNNSAGFTDISVNQTRLIFISLDFSHSSPSEQKTALKNLAEFVNMQDIPIIIAGIFGQESWSQLFLDFMEKTGLEVKNSIILSDGNSRVSPLIAPSLNILAYKDFGIQNRGFLSAKHNPRRPLLININY